MKTVTSDVLRDDTANVLHRVASGDTVEITVDGESVARLIPVENTRPLWMSAARLVDRLAITQADPGLADELRELDESVLGRTDT